MAMEPLNFGEKFENNLIDKDGGSCDLKAEEYDYIGLYFSAHWCPPCKGFTPKLAEYYNEVKTNGKKKLQIVFISSDRDVAAFNGYFAEMPWIALKYEDRDLKNELSEKYGVRGIPTLVILDRNGELKAKDGRSLAMKNDFEMNW